MKKITLTSIIFAFCLSGMGLAQELTLLGSYDMAWPAYEVVVDGDYAYLPDADSGLVVLDVSDPTNPFLRAQGLPETRVENIAQFGNYIYGTIEFYPYVPETTLFKVIDVTNPAAPFLMSSFKIVGTVRDLDAIQDYVFALNDYGNSLNAIDVSNPYDPHMAGSIHVTGLFGKLQVVDDYLYIITSSHGLRIFSIAYPNYPYRVAYCNTPGFGYDLYVQGGYAYIADSYDLSIVDVSDPLSPYLLQDTFQVYTDGGITADNDHVFIGAHFGLEDEVFAAIDVQNPLDPAFLCSYQMPANSFEGKPVVANNCVYLPQYHGPYELLIFDAAVTGIEDNPIRPQSFATLESYPNPFNSRCTISFSIPSEAEIEIAVYNILGQKIDDLYSGIEQAGYHTITWDASGYPSGVYFAGLRKGIVTKSVKMILLK